MRFTLFMSKKISLGCYFIFILNKSLDSKEMQYICYIIWNGSRTYVGITNTEGRRIRQHNGEIKGGATATRGRGVWKYLCFVRGFETRSTVQKFESRLKRYRRVNRGRGMMVAIKAMLHIMYLFRDERIVPEWELLDFYIPSNGPAMTREQELSDTLVEQTLLYFPEQHI